LQQANREPHGRLGGVGRGRGAGQQSLGALELPQLVGASGRRQVGAGCRGALAPATLLGQLHRACAALVCLCQLAAQHVDDRQLREAVECDLLVLVLGCERERLVQVGDGSLHVAAAPQQRGAELTQREAAKRGPAVARTVVCRSAQLVRQALGVTGMHAQARVAQPHCGDDRPRLARIGTQLPRERQERLGVLEIAILQARAGDGRRQTRVGCDDLRRQLRHRAAHRRRAAAQEQLQPMLGDQATGLLPVSAGERVADCEHRLPLLGIPAGRATVQGRDLPRMGVAQVGAQQLREQWVIAIPAATYSGWLHRGAEALELHQRQRATLAPGERVRQLGAELVNQAGAQHELATLLWQAREHLGDQVVGDCSIGAGELGQKTPRLGVSPQRQRRQPHRGGPALGACPQRVDLRVGECQLQPLAQLGGLLAVERELGDTQLGERATGTQALGRQRRIGAARQHDAQLLGGVADKEVDRGGGRGAGELVDLVEHQHERRAQLCQAVDQQREEALGAGSRRSDEVIKRAAGLERSRTAQRAQEVFEQPVGLIVLPVERQPARGAGQRARRDPRGEQHGLAGAGRRGEQDDALLDALVEGVVQSPALDQMARGRRYQQLGGDRRDRRGWDGRRKGWEWEGNRCDGCSRDGLGGKAWGRDLERGSCPARAPRRLIRFRRCG